MTYVDFRYVESSKFKKRLGYSIESSRINSQGKAITELIDSGTRYFADFPSNSLNAGQKEDHSVVETGLFKSIGDMEIVVKHFPAFETFFREKKKITCTYKGQKYQVIEVVNVGGESVYLALSLKRVSNE